MARPPVSEPSPMTATTRKLLALEVARGRDAQRRRDRGRGVAGVEDVVLALLALEEARDAAVRAQRVEAIAPAGEHLVGVALVPDVPDELVARRVEDVVQGEGQLDARRGSEARWPPVWLTPDEAGSCRSSSASSGQHLALGSWRRSAGLLMRSSNAHGIS